MDVFVTDIWETAKTAGPFGMLFLLGALWYLNGRLAMADARADKLQNERDALLERVLNAISDVADAMGETVNRRRGRP